MRTRDRAHGKHPQFVDLGREGRELIKLADFLNSRPMLRSASRAKLARRMTGPSLAEVHQDTAMILDLARGGAAVTEAAEQFHRLAAEVPVVLSARVGADGRLVPMLAAWEPETRDSRTAPTQRDRVVAALQLLWHALFSATTTHTRLKRCDCQRWFVDVTLGNRKMTCSTRCAERIKKRNQRRTRRGRP